MTAKSWRDYADPTRLVINCLLVFTGLFYLLYWATECGLDWLGRKR